jgi:hypothetical protein
VLADEAVDHPEANLDAYDGIVLKPARLGIRRCIELAREARTRGWIVTFGCHLQSSLSSNATLLISGLSTSEWIDLDSVLLVGDDPFDPPSVHSSSGRISCPVGYGLCARPTAALPWESIFQQA